MIQTLAPKTYYYEQEADIWPYLESIGAKEGMETLHAEGDKNMLSIFVHELNADADLSHVGLDLGFLYRFEKDNRMIMFLLEDFLYNPLRSELPMRGIIDWSIARNLDPYLKIVQQQTGRPKESVLKDIAGKAAQKLERHKISTDHLVTFESEGKYVFYFDVLKD